MAKILSQTNKRSQIGQSRHCTSYSVSTHLPLINFKPPAQLIQALKNDLIEHPDNSALCKDYVRCLNNLVNVRKIDPEHYFILFKIFLYMEDFEVQRIAEKHTIKDHEITSNSDIFTVNVPSLDKDNPFVLIGDTVVLCDIKSNKKYYSRIINMDGKNITISLLKKNAQHQIMNARVNIMFYPSKWTIHCSHYALHIINKYNLINVLYPKMSTSHCFKPQYNVNLDWVNKNVSTNQEQKQAVLNILNNSAHPTPYVLFGPPGTGKTATLVEAICQITRQNKSKRILVCTPSNTAADEITKRLLATIPEGDIFRMYATSKNWNEIDEVIDPCSNFVDDTIVFLPKDIFLLKNIVITTLLTCIRLASLRLRSDHFSYIFIDEASQSVETEALIPFTLACTNDMENNGTLHAQIIVAGDPFQLGPVVQCKQIEHLYGKSMLERLMECGQYQKVGKKYNPRYITKLLRNYRSCAPILHIPNKLFYDNELICCKKSDTDELVLPWRELQNKRFPVIFCAVKGKELRTESRSVYNKNEIVVVLHYLKKLLSLKSGKRFKQKDIGIVTPFKQQQIMIRKELNLTNLNNVSVGTVELFQGQEKEVIILSTARSQSFKHGSKEHIGFLSHKKRFNVALTRAKKLLIVVGNPSLLCKDECWNELWEYCQENNACITVTNSFIKRIEKQTLKSTYAN